MKTKVYFTEKSLHKIQRKQVFEFETSASLYNQFLVALEEHHPDYILMVSKTKKNIKINLIDKNFNEGGHNIIESFNIADNYFIVSKTSFPGYCF